MDKVQRKLAAIKWTAPVWACAFSEFVSIISALDYMHLDLNTFHGNFPYRNPFNLRAHQRNLTEQFSLLVLFLSFFFIPPFGSINGGLSLCVYIYIYIIGVAMKQLRLKRALASDSESLQTNNEMRLLTKKRKKKK